MKKLLPCLLSAVLLILSSADSVFASPFKGTVIDILGESIVTIQTESDIQAQKGDQVSLTYMAGALPMAIGEFEITAAQKTIIMAKSISLNMPPQKGMKIQIDVLTRSSRGNKADKNSGSRQAVSSNAEITSNAEINGEVSEVMSGGDIKIDIANSGVRPGIGWTADLFYVTSKGRELPVGTWKVTSVEGQVVLASKVKGMGNARKGLKAVMHGGQKSVNVKPQKKKTVHPDKKAGKKVQLLGETPPSKPQKKASAPKDSASMDSASMDSAKFDKYVEQLKKENPERTNKTALTYSARAGSWPKYWLGIWCEKNESPVGQSRDKTPNGFRVVRVYTDSPAEKYGLKVGDILYSFNGELLDEKTSYPVSDFLSKNKKENLVIELDSKFKRKKITVKLQRIKNWKKLI